jgi:serine protease AprX
VVPTMLESMRPFSLSGPRGVSLLALACALAALAAPAVGRADAYVPAGLLQNAKDWPSQTFSTIVVTNGDSNSNNNVENGQFGDVHQRYTVLPAVATNLTGDELESLAAQPGIVSITPDAAMRPTGAQNTLWPLVTGVPAFWAGGLLFAPLGVPTIAIIDSGVEPGRVADFGGRIVTQIDFTCPTCSATDDNGHGTLVAGLAAGASTSFPGVVPAAKIVSLRVVDANGMAKTSDVIAAADWIFKNGKKYGIRVANFSLRSSYPNAALRDPLNIAVRRLWLGGTVVVTAAGNDGPQRMLYAPASDPFVITVGASDVVDTVGTDDDVAAPWSSYGYTAEGFAKPELVAPGRYLAGPVPTASALATTKPERVLAPGYMWMSGTSFAAPIVAGAAAQLLALHPTWTPDQVKGALMLTTNAMPSSTPLSVGVGTIDVLAAAAVSQPPDPNAGLQPFVVKDKSGARRLDFDAWEQYVNNAASWSSASWSSASWSSASWSSASWSSASWSSAARTDASWSSASWSSASLSSASWSSASWSSAAADE